MKNIKCHVWSGLKLLKIFNALKGKKIYIYR